MDTTTRRPRALAPLLALMLAACSRNYPPDPAPAVSLPDGAFTMPDGAKLPYHQWLPVAVAPAPATPAPTTPEPTTPEPTTPEPTTPEPTTPAPTTPTIVVLALHGFNDSGQDAWSLPAPVMARAGIAVFAPDQRGFGAAPDRGRWAGASTLANDAAAMARLLHAKYPAARLYLMGESMGGAVIMDLEDQPNRPSIAGAVLIAPAVWARNRMTIPVRATLFLARATVPALKLGAGPFRVHASDNRAALIAFSRDPRTIVRTRVAAIAGLVDLMDAAAIAAPHVASPTLFLYGGHDELIPKPAMAATWRALPQTPTIREAYYPTGYHLLLRDQARATPTTDIIAWLRNPLAALPSPAESAAHAWLAQSPPAR